MFCDHFQTYFVGIFNLDEAFSGYDFNVGIGFPQCFFGIVITLSSAVKHGTMDDETDFGMGFILQIFADHASCIGAVFPFVDGDTGDIIVAVEILRNVAQKNQTCHPG